jgi:acyl dehydratase
VTRQFDAREDRFGRYFDDFEVGDRYRHWPGHTITEAEDHLFCLLTRAVSPVHTDSEYARAEMEAGRNIVVGTLIYSLLVGISVPDTSGKAIAALGTESLQHLSPVFHGDTLTGESTVVAKRLSKSRPNAGIITIDTRGRNQDGVVVCAFRRSFLVPVGPLA